MTVSPATPSVPSPAQLLQQLIRFDTTNPPGHERACIEYIQGLIESAGIPTTIVAKDPERPILVARIKGRGAAPPLLLYGHVDVVPTEGQVWTHPPFEGKEVDGWIWGRGALDMKAGVAMFLSAFLRLAVSGEVPAGDILFCALSDEEAGGDWGAKFLVEEHPGLFAGVKYALGEFGGFPHYIGGKKLYLIQVAEKQIGWLKVTFRGPAGHASAPVRGGAMAKLARFLTRLDQERLPVHITPPVRQMIEAIAARVGGAQGLVLRQLLNPALTATVLKLLGPAGATFEPLLRNTATPTILHGGTKINVIPGEVSIELDGRLLPGLKPQVLVEEVRALAGPEAEIELVRFDAGPAETDAGLLPLLDETLRAMDPAGVSVPLVLQAVTDARHLARIGIQSYGFTPMQLPPDFAFVKSIHAADERIPAASVDWGAEAVYRVLVNYKG